MNKILGHLAQFASFSRQGELLCTQGLAYLLRDPAANGAFTAFVGQVSGISFPDTLEWKPELVQTDGGRPDVEGRDNEGRARVKIEAKLGAEFGNGQLESYVRGLEATGQEGSLLVLVPGNRVAESTDYVRATFACAGDAPWGVASTPAVHAAVISWEQIFDHLLENGGNVVEEDLEQFRAMYRVFNGDDIEPITSDEQALAWREKEGWWLTLVDLATRRLAKGERVMPLKDGRRYICEEKAPKKYSCYSMEVRDPFAGHITPIWMCFHKKTYLFDEIRSRLTSLIEEGLAITSGGHIWIPLVVPLNSGKEQMIKALVSQTQEVCARAFPEAYAPCL